MPAQFDIVAQLRIQGPTNLGAVARDVRNQLKSANGTVGLDTSAATAGLQRVSSGARASAAALRQMQAQAASTTATLRATVTVTDAGTASLRNFGEQAGLAARRFAAFSVAAGAMVTVVRGIQEGTRAAIEFGLSMNKVEQVSDEVSSKIGALRAEIGSLATGLGVSSAALAETAITLKQAGLSIDQTKSALKALALTDLAPTFDGMKQSTEGLIASFRQFNLSSTQFEQTLSSMNAVAGKFAVESSDIITAVQKAGGAFKLSAGDMKSGSEALNEFMALFTSVRATTRESADAIATGLRTVFTRFQRGDTVKALADLGINLRYTREEARALGDTNLTDQFVGAYEAVRRLSQGLEGLRETDPRYSQVVEQLGGYRQISRVVPLLKEFKTAEEAKNVAVAGGISLQLAAEKRQEALANKIGKLKEEYLELFRKITESKSFQVLSDSMLSVASAFAKVLDYARPLLPLLVGLAAVKIGTNLGGLAGGFARAFAAPPGAAVSAAKPAAGVLRFATGGPVGGSGNTDTVPAVLTPGEFVVKKSSAQRIGYQRLHQMNDRPERFAGGGKVPAGKADGKAETGEYAPAGTRLFSPLPPSGPRKPLAPRANDALVQALSLLTAPNRRRFDAGGLVAPTKGALALQGLLDEFTDRTGVPWRELVSRARVVSDLPGPAGGQARGVFRTGSRELLINRSQVRTLEQLRRTVFHELGHALDLRVGGGGALASGQTGSPAALAARAYSGRLSKTSLVRAASPARAQYLTSSTESFAEAVADTYAGAGAKGQSLLSDAERGVFERKVVAPARAQINYGFIDPTFSAKRRASAVASGGRLSTLLSAAARLFGYASGGFVPGSGNNDTQPALLMPGEFVLNKGAVARLGVPALRDINEGRTRVRVQKFAGGGPVGDPARLRELLGQRSAVEDELDVERRFQAQFPDRAAATGNVARGLAISDAAVEKLTRQLEELNKTIGALEAAEAARATEARAAADRLAELTKGPSAPPAPAAGPQTRGQELLARLKSSKGGAPRPADGVQAVSFGGDEDRPFVSYAADVYRDSEDPAETAREKEVRALQERLSGSAAAPQPAPVSFVSQLKTKEQQEFFARFAVGKNGGKSLAEAAGEYQAQRSGDLGRAGIASGLVENAAFEAVAKLAVSPPEGFDPTRADADKFVFRAVQQAVQNQLNKEYGSNAKRFGGYAPTDAAGKLIEPAGREPDPAEGADPTGDLARARAREAEQARQLEKVKAALPPNALSGDRKDRVAALRALGANFKDASFGAADARFIEALAAKVGPALAGAPTVASTATSAPGATPPAPLGRQVDALLRAIVESAPPTPPRGGPPLTDAEHEYQLRQLAAAQQQFGSTFGVAEDEVRSNRQLGRGQARGDIQAFEFEQRRRAQSGAFVDPLVVARETRRQRLDEQRQAQQAVAQRANAGGRQRVLAGEELYGFEDFEVKDSATGAKVPATAVNIQNRATAPATVGDRIAERQARDAAGIAGITDPLQIKNAAVNVFRNGEAGILGDNGKAVLDAVRDKLSSAQFAQVVRAAQQAGYLPDPAAARPKPTSEDVATFTTSDDGTRTVSGGLLKDRIDRLTAERVRARGGERNLSTGTLDDIRQQAGREEDAQVRRELVSAHKNLLAALNPEMTAHERNRKALEDVERAMQGLAKVSRDSSGKLLGLSSTVEQATRAGVSAPGAGGAGFRFSSAVGGRLASAREFLANNRVTRLNERLADYTQTPLFGLAATGIGIGTTVLADKLDRNAGSADDAVRTAAGTSGYRTNKAASGTLQGAALGAAVGSVAGPVGIAVGAVVGGLGGLVSSLSDAARDIRQAKINNALTELGDKLSAFATGIPDAAALAGVRTNLTEYRTNADKRARDEATNSGFYQFITGAWYEDPVDTQKYVENLRANNRKELGPQLPLITQGLSKQAERLGRENAGARPDDLVRRLRESGGGVNAELLRLAAELRKVPVRQVEEEVRKALVAAQQQRRIQDEGRAARASTEQQVNTFGRLLQAVQAASDALYGLQQRAGALADVLDGNISSSRVSAHAERLNDGLGRPDGSALQPLDIVAAATGGYGAKLRESGGAADAVARALPGVLASVAASGGLEKDNASSRVVEGLYRSLGYSDRTRAPEGVQRAVLAVQAGVNDTVTANGEGAFREEVGTDATGYADKLLASVTGPLKDAGGKLATQLEDNANRLVDGLTSIHQRLQQVGQLYDQLGSLRTQNFRQNLQFRAEAAGWGAQALDFASVQELEYGANQRQQRLAGVSGPRAFDPRFLGAELAQVRTRIGAAVERQQAAFERPDGVRSGAFGAAAEEVLRLKDRASNLQQALKGLADVAERNAVIQEKLNRLKQEEDGRLGLAERVATASPEERLRLTQGAILANEANNRGSLDGFSADQNRLIFDFLNSARGVTLTGFQGAPRAEDVRNNILQGGQFGAQFQLTAAQKQERAALQGAATGRGKTAEEAVAQLIANQEAGSAELFRNLQQQQTQFFSKLERLLLGLRRADLENSRARAAADQGALQERGKSRDALAGVGVTTTAQLEALRGRSGDVEGLRAAIAAQKAERDNIAAAKGLVGGLTPHSDPAGQLGAVLARTNLSDEQIKRVSERTEKLSGSDEFVRLRGDARKSAPDGSAAQKRALDAVEQKVLRQALATEVGYDSDASKNVREARAKLSGIAGVDPLKVEETLRGPNADALVKGLSAFDAGSNKIEDFGAKLTAAAAEVAKFDAALKALSAPAAGPAGPVTPRAYGGDIFKPVGTDTVPAMLTPGEFVVNARSASANAGLLHRINEARGAVYLADGGRAGYDLFAASPYGRVAQNEAQRVAFDRVKRQQDRARERDGGLVNSEALRQLHSRYGGRDLYERFVRQQATDTAAGAQAAAAQALNFNIRAGAFAGVRRPGDEGQLSIAARVAGVAERSLDERFRQDAALRRYTEARVGRQDLNIRRFASGGLVGGAGTGDTVPSLLTPGEFVLNAGAVARLGAHNVQRFNQGGPVGRVNYLAEGGVAQTGGGSSGPVSFAGEAVKAMTDLSSVLAQFVQQSGGFGQTAQQLTQAFTVFVGGAQQLTQALNNMPRSFTGQFEHRVTVVHNGAEVFAKLTPYLEQVVTDKVNATLSRVFKEHMPDAGVQL